MNTPISRNGISSRSDLTIDWLMQTMKTFIPQPLKRTLRSLGNRANPYVARLRQRTARPSFQQIRSHARIGMIYTCPTEMSIDERLFLYAFIRGIRPERVLEIGTHHGGSATIMACAMEDVSIGKIVCVDPAPDITVSRRLFHGRVHLLEKPSPEAIPEAARIAGGPFDLALIDGIHVYDQAKSDFEAALRHMTSKGYLLFHDGFNFGVNEAIKETIEANSRLHDCGYVCATPTTAFDFSGYGGFRLVRLDSAPVADPRPALERGYRAVNKPVPQWDAELLNHDAWYCRAIKPCPRCQRMQANSCGENTRSR